jgi:hypothetical protein
MRRFLKLRGLVAVVLGALQPREGVSDKEVGTSLLRLASGRFYLHICRWKFSERASVAFSDRAVVGPPGGALAFEVTISILVFYSGVPREVGGGFKPPDIPKFLQW